MDGELQITTKQPSTNQYDDSKNVYGNAVDMCYNYGYIIIISLLIVYIFYYSYNSFCENQNSEPFIEKTVKTGIDADKSFDVDEEVKKLSDLQEQYLRKLNNQRDN
jgi:hypothetical protein